MLLSIFSFAPFYYILAKPLGGGGGNGDTIDCWIEVEQLKGRLDRINSIH